MLRSADMQISQSFQILHVHVHVVLKAHCQLNCNCVNFIRPNKKNVVVPISCSEKIRTVL